MSTDLLKDRSYTIIVARSGISRERNHPWFNEWVDAQASLIDLAKKCQEFDPDGLTIYEASSFLKKYEQATVNRLAELLQKNNRSDATYVIEINVVEAIADVLNHYFEHKEHHQTKPKGEIIIVILDKHGIDGIGDIQQLIIKSTQMMDYAEELGITFIQIGDDATTRRFMTGLDDDLTQVGAKFDIVDTKYWHEVQRKSITQFLIDALFD
ncbi:hypothetical protein [Limnoraphis robusta]|uniref:von Willebrand factor A n=1 Tax=Limnoraphis robusta CS-951 TaxID=1637645 RepID=A0A0F5YJU7_9CYAN|nr:hypothetical protein [Limnoraphis robusta]KKD39146.1 von Willebrand factor A [Limnoraphis robusta CS-951]MEA5499495.1 hypothetical protein [Limnoraphis robusta BA-68 BA1]